jgi:hypothetical protein
MAEAIVSDWLSDYAALEPGEIKSFAAQHEHNHDVSQALYSVLNEKSKYPEVSLYTVVDQKVYQYNMHLCFSAAAVDMQSIVQLLSIN